MSIESISACSSGHTFFKLPLLFPRKRIGDQPLVLCRTPPEITEDYRQFQHPSQCKHHCCTRNGVECHKDRESPCPDDAGYGNEDPCPFPPQAGKNQKHHKRAGKGIAQHSAVPEVRHARCEVLEQTDHQKCHQPNAGYGQ